MYIARYRNEQMGIVQAAVRFGVVVVEPPDRPKGWWANFRKAMDQLIASLGVDFAFRIGLRDRNLERVLLINAPEDREDQLNALVVAFLKLNAIVEESVEFCLTRDRHDQMTGSFPRVRGWVRNEPYRFKDCQLACDFHIHPLTEQLLAMAFERDWNVAWQVNVCRYRPTAEDLRWVKKNLVRIESERIFPDNVVSHERRIVHRMSEAQFLIDEFVGFDEGQARDRLSELIEEEFAATLGRLGFSSPPWEEGRDGNFDEQIFSGFHSSLFQELEPLTKAASAARSDEVRAIVTWQPPVSWDSRGLANTRVESEDEQDYLKRIELRLARIERVLQERNVASTECGELKKALGISRADPPFALAKARQILEGIVERVYRDQKPGQPIKPLFNMIEELTETGRVFPRHIATYLHTIRVIGNLVVHGGSKPAETTADPKRLSETDVELTLLMTLNLVEWYLFEYARPAK